MRACLPVILVVLLPGTAAFAQSAGINTETTRELNALHEMATPTVRPETLLRSLSFEEGDDPTVAAQSVPRHEPARAARKVAERAERLAKKKQHEEAAEGYRQAVNLDPLYYEAWNNLALELEAAGHADEAAQTLRRMMEADPKHVLAFTNLATLLCARRQYAAAETVLREAMKLHSYSFKANYLLGAVLIDQGKWTDEAKSKLQYAQVRYPEAKALLSKWK